MHRERAKHSLNSLHADARPGTFLHLTRYRLEMITPNTRPEPKINAPIEIRNSQKTLVRHPQRITSGCRDELLVENSVGSELMEFLLSRNQPQEIAWQERKQNHKQEKINQNLWHFAERAVAGFILRLC